MKSSSTADRMSRLKWMIQAQVRYSSVHRIGGLKISMNEPTNQQAYFDHFDDYDLNVLEANRALMLL